MPLLNAKAAVLVTNAAVQQVQDNANDDWITAAKAAVLKVARGQATFTVDDVWVALETSCEFTHEPSALGAVMRSMTKQGYIQRTGEYRVSERVSRHRAPLRVWRLT